MILAETNITEFWMTSEGGSTSVVRFKPPGRTKQHFLQRRLSEVIPKVSAARVARLQTNLRQVLSLTCFRPVHA